MNLALQKRHEQLERWRQNEAIVEQDSQQQQQQQQPVNSRSNRSIQRLNFETFPKDISRSNFTDTITTKSHDYKSSRGDSINRSSSSGKNNRTSTRRNRLKSDLQVKFSNATLFLTACACGDLVECERLLDEQQVNIEVTTPDGLTGLHEAAICGNIQLIEYLINRGANINCCDNEGWTPLHAAASLGQDKIVEYLLDHGADATIVNCENLLAYDLARNERVRELIGDHLQDFDIEYLRSQEERAIQKDIERWIKTSQYDERSHPVTNATVLHVLAAKGHVSLMKQILETPSLKKQINLEAKDNEGFTPLLAASFWSQKEIVELLIEHGANIFAQANNGYKISSIVSNTIAFISLLQSEKIFILAILSI